MDCDFVMECNLVMDCDFVMECDFLMNCDLAIFYYEVLGKNLKNLNLKVYEKLLYDPNWAESTDYDLDIIQKSYFFFDKNF